MQNTYVLNKALKSSLKAGQLKKNESHLIISNYKAHYYHKILVSDMKIKLVRKGWLLLMAAVLLHYSLSKGAEDSDRLHTGQCQLMPTACTFVLPGAVTQ